MYITCQKCKASFVVNPEHIGSNGRRVRCSKCQHTWYVDPVVTSQTDKVVTPQDELFRLPGSGIHLPIILPEEKKKSSSDRVVMLVLFLIFSFVIFFSKSVDVDLISGFPHDVSISDVKIYHNKDSNKMTLRYIITNDGEKLTMMPDIRIQLFDAGHKSLRIYDMLGGEAELAPNQRMKFRTELNDIPEDASTADISIGSKLDFISDFLHK